MSAAGKGGIGIFAVGPAGARLEIRGQDYEPAMGVFKPSAMKAFNFYNALPDPPERADVNARSAYWRALAVELPGPFELRADEVLLGGAHAQPYARATVRYGSGDDRKEAVVYLPVLSVGYLWGEVAIVTPQEKS